MKITTKATGIATRGEFEDKINAAAETEVHLRRLKADMDAELQAIRDKYDPQTKPLETRLETLLNACGTYAALHQDEVLKPGLRQGETALALYGFRLGNPTLVLLNRKHTWKTVCAAIRDRGTTWTDKYLKLPDPKPNKDALKTLSDEELASLGCRVEQTDSFYIDARDNSAKD